MRIADVFGADSLETNQPHALFYNKASTVTR